MTKKNSPPPPKKSDFKGRKVKHSKSDSCTDIVCCRCETIKFKFQNKVVSEKDVVKLKEDVDKIETSSSQSRKKTKK